LGAGGFVPVAAFDLTVEPSCIRISCPSFEPGVDVAAFIWQGPDGYVLDADPCLTPLFAPTDETVRLLLACVRGDECLPLAIPD
jgi:hypothetical protein